jgi:hypothetical protein
VDSSDNKAGQKKTLFSMQPTDLKMWDAARFAGIRPNCSCMDAQYNRGRFGELSLHSQVQDTKCEGWQLLCGLVEAAASEGLEDFAPGLAMPQDLWSQIITLPISISKLTSVRKLYLYGSFLVRVPVEIGDMVNLEELDLYTSYRLHWLPFEVTRCSKLKRSRFSTRALYGNNKYRPPFPRLGNLPFQAGAVANKCSICNADSLQQRWISLRVGTDVLPLLANVCSDACIGRLPSPTQGYVSQPHTGGLELVQPPPR